MNAVDFCPPAPSLNDSTVWMLTYACTLQCMGEAAQGQRWHPSGMHFSIQVLLLVNPFILETGAELTEGDIMACWCLGARKILPQKRDSPFADVIACLDEFMR